MGLGHQHPQSDLEQLDGYEFAREYLTGYVGSYLAFRHREPTLLAFRASLEELHNFARQVQDEYALSLFKRYEQNLAEPSPYGVMQWVINIPMGEARVRE